MKVPFALRRGERQSATALYVSGDVEAVMRLCVGMAGSPMIHDLAGGFLLRLPAASEDVIPGAIRLRSLSPNLFVPVDAELTPALLADEAQALVQSRGLVFLPGGQVLAFAPDVRLGPADLLTVPRLPRQAWRPLPEAPARPDELREIVLEVPDTSLDVLLGQSTDVGSEPVVPPSEVSPTQQASGQVQAMLGQGLFWLGSKLNWKGLAQVGANLIRRAIEQAPTISERVLGQQESRLRQLLRQFKDGNVDDALRHALPMGDPGGRGGRVASDAQLPFHNLRYKLSEFLGLAVGGASVWLGGSSIMDELQREYRKAAEDAANRGDFLRAAVIYGKLLRDWARMASMLARAGMHHDAALVYLQRMSDPMQAAREFEAAGEFDRALELYRKRGEHLLAGDLLRRIGEPDEAVTEYLLAAQQQATSHLYSAAGKLMLQRAERPDLAETFFVAGWKTRPGADAMPCLMELLELYGGQAKRTQLLQIMEEADQYFAPVGEEYRAGQYYNRLATMATTPPFADLREELHDRALLGLALKLRQHGKAGTTTSGGVSMLFGTSRVWDAALVRDADVAKRGLKKVDAVREEARRIRTHSAEVVSACAAGQTGDLFLGFDDGALVHYSPRSERTVLTTNSSPVVALSCDALGETVLLVRKEETQLYSLSLVHTGSVPCRERVVQSPREAKETPRLSPLTGSRGKQIAAYWDGELLEWVNAHGEVTSRRVDVHNIQAVMVLEHAEHPVILLVAGNAAYLWTDQWRTVPLPCRLAEPRAPGLPSLNWQPREPGQLELTALTSDGNLWVMTFDVAALRLVSAARVKDPPSFLAGVGGRLVAGVERGGVRWYRPTANVLYPIGQTCVEVSDAVACFNSPLTNELLIVCRRGDLVRVSVPG